jgi:hypothetical protein
MVANSGRVQFGTPVKGKTVRQVQPGRICRSEGCATVLSVYNDSEECSLHAAGKVTFARDRGAFGLSN